MHQRFVFRKLNFLIKSVISVMGVYNISLSKGENFDLTATLQNSTGGIMNLSGYSVRGYVRYGYGSSGILIDLAPSVLDSPSGVVAINLSPAQTAALPVTVALYDVERYTSGNFIVNKILNGSFTINPEATY